MNHPPLAETGVHVVYGATPGPQHNYHTNDHSDLVHSIPKLETVQVSFNNDWLREPNHAFGGANTF